MFRLCLALAVVGSHISRFEIGRLAVLLFFFLSGYWVSRMWTAKYRGRLRTFYASRYLRIAPLYLLALVAAALLFRAPLQLQNLSLLGVASGDHDPIGISWSLDVELQFYLLTPLIAAAISASPIWMVAAGSLVIAALGWLAAHHLGVISVAQYLPAFALGVLVCARDWRPGQRLAMGSMALFLAATAIFWLAPGTNVFLDKTVADPFHRDIFAFIWMLPLIPYVTASLQRPSKGADKLLGDLSFPVYLVHYPVVVFLSRLVGESTETKLLAVVLSLLLAIALHFAFDRPMEKLRVRWTERRSTRTSAVS